MKLWQTIKNFLKKILPPPTRALIRESQAIQDEVRKTATLIKELRLQLDSANQQLSGLRHELEVLRRENKNGLDELQRKLEAVGTDNKALLSELAAGNNEAVRMLRGEIMPLGVIASRNTAEITWAEVFNNTITNSTWLSDKTFSPGRWAVGYQMMYVMYRVLDEMHPKNILELGLGQSTRMLAQYAAKYADVRHTVVEHDGEWIAFFKNSYDIPENTDIVQLEREFVPYKEAEAVRVFKGFAETFKNRKFDFIMIDAPLGGDMKQYARIDILSIIPDALAESFVIVMDDTERSGESKTIKEIEAVLTENGIDYARGNYSGKKDSVLICDRKNAFLTTM